MVHVKCYVASNSKNICGIKNCSWESFVYWRGLSYYVNIKSPSIQGEQKLTSFETFFKQMFQIYLFFPVESKYIMFYREFHSKWTQFFHSTNIFKIIGLSHFTWATVYIDLSRIYIELSESYYFRWPRRRARHWRRNSAVRFTRHPLLSDNS